MIDDIKDISVIEKNKQIKRARLNKAIWQCLPIIILASGGISLFSIFMDGDFMSSFTPENAVSTAGRFIMILFIFVALFASIYDFTDKGKYIARDYYIVTIVMVLTIMLTITAVHYLNNDYIFPIGIVSLIVFVLINRRVATIATAATAIVALMGYLFTNGIDTNMMYGKIAGIACNTIGSVVVIFFIDQHFTRLKFLLVSLASALASIPFVIACTLATGDVSMNLLFNSLFSYGSAVAAIFIFMPLVAIFEGIFNIADDFKLNELTNLSHPLLKRLASEAPGTFNHSLVVGNLAEACAEAIGENPHLARAAAYYHDIGKLKAPIYFSENQSTYNPHDELIPEVSVSMITSHTLFGEILAKQYHLPDEIVAICRQHHGTAPVGYFYRKALSLTEEGDLPSTNYAYTGPKPMTKVAAIVMIADTVEAACRAYMPDSKEEFVKRIESLIGEKMSLAQFDECPITMSDINLIKETIIEVLPSVHHSRVSYEKRK